VSWPTYRTISWTNQTLSSSSREKAQAWITENIPAETKIAIEAYSPYLNPEAYYVMGIGNIIDHSPEWYVENDFQYLVFSEGSFGRFYADNLRYKEQVAAYNRFFDTMHLVESFADSYPEIYIYTVK
jgi:hypothetical protein